MYRSDTLLMDKVSPNFLIGKIIKPCGFKIEVGDFIGVEAQQKQIGVWVTNIRKKD